LNNLYKDFKAQQSTTRWVEFQKFLVEKKTCLVDMYLNMVLDTAEFAVANDWDAFTRFAASGRAQPELLKKFVWAALRPGVTKPETLEQVKANAAKKCPAPLKKSCAWIKSLN